MEPVLRQLAKEPFLVPLMLEQQTDHALELNGNQQEIKSTAYDA